MCFVIKPYNKMHFLQTSHSFFLFVSDLQHAPSDFIRTYEDVQSLYSSICSLGHDIHKYSHVTNASILMNGFSVPYHTARSVFLCVKICL